jgi:predicted DsbA family dithiol-disulfide isomerase
LRAHRLIRFAGDNGCAEPVVEALFRAYFIEGLDIGLPETLGELAARAGLCRAETCEYLSGDAGTAEVRAEEQRARRLGIHAVPYFVLERDYAISGAQEPEMFLPIFDIAAGIVDLAPAEA